MRLHLHLLIFILCSMIASCSSLKNILATNSNEEAERPPIENPFGALRADQVQSANPNVVLRTKKGDRSVEVEMPRSPKDVSELVVPMSPAFTDTTRAPASLNGNTIDDRYRDRKPTRADREIASTLPSNPPDREKHREEVELGLGLGPAFETAPETDMSYLAGLDQIKQLFKAGRFEAALIENDGLLREYPTDPKLFEMRGTLLDRIGKPELALQAWEQALRINPKNGTLKKFIDRRRARMIAQDGAVVPHRTEIRPAPVTEEPSLIPPTNGGTP